jgi:3-hydroxy-3-methylglutaryl CoA synthase
MIGITSYSAYIPWYRLSRAKMNESTGFLMTFPTPGERSVANQNEDSVTMAAAASIYCLEGEDRGKVDGLYFATSTPSYLVRQQASIVSSALDLREDIRVADFESGNKAGTTALMAALDAVKGGSMRSALVAAADCRVVKPGNPQEYVYGDGGAALMVGKDEVVAELEGTYSLSVDFVDRWRAVFEEFEHSWEERWIRDEGYEKLVPRAIEGMLKQQSLAPGDIAKVAFCYPMARQHANLAKKMGFTPAQVQDHLLEKVGDACAAWPLMMLVGALEEAKPGDRILVASYGQGVDVLLLKVTDKIDRMKDKWGVKKNLARRKELESWERYASMRGAVKFYLGPRDQEYGFTSYSMAWRERKQLSKLYGCKCLKCGTPQFPIRRICVNPGCKAIDQMEDYRFSDKTGKIFSFVVDYQVAVPVPPVVHAYINFEGGGRIQMQVVDVDPFTIQIGQPMEMTYRRKLVDIARGVSIYYWCATPVRQ